MGAGGANLRRFGTHHDMSAVAALPDLYLTLLENLLGLHILQQGAVTFLMVFLNGSH